LVHGKTKAGCGKDSSFLSSLKKLYNIYVDLFGTVMGVSHHTKATLDLYCDVLPLSTAGRARSFLLLLGLKWDTVGTRRATIRALDIFTSHYHSVWVPRNIHRV
jgi:hypothetical protein